MKPFTYYLRHIPTNKKYYGVRTAKGCDPSELWVSYFSSSTLVKELIKKYGKNSFIVEVRKTFDTKEDAMLWERKVLSKLNASHSEEWLNKTNGGGAGSHSDETRKKIQSNNARYWLGKERDDLSKKFKGHNVSEETRNKISEKLKGKPLPAVTKQKMKGRTPWNKGMKNVQVPWNKGRSGYKVTTSGKLKGRIPWNKGKKTGQVPWNKGLSGYTMKRKTLDENNNDTNS